jgi:hypothetical protein
MSKPIDPTAKLVILTEDEARQYRLDVVRAFVARVEKKMPQFLEGKPLTSAKYVLQLELSGVEKEASE